MTYKKNKNSAQSADQSAQQNNADRSGVSKRVGKQKNTADKLTETVKNTVKTPKKKNATKKASAEKKTVKSQKTIEASEKRRDAAVKNTAASRDATVKNTAAAKDSLKKKAAGLSRYGSISPKELKKNSGVRIAFLGGINEIGKNLTVFEYGNDMIILDCGMSFPDADMPGIDYVIPDFSYIERNADRIKALFITHGHEDHIGGVTYLLKSVNVPVYATNLTIGLIEGKLREHLSLIHI